jgi:hypothetical protein
VFDFIRECNCFTNQNTKYYTERVPVTFVSLGVFVYSAIPVVNLPCRFTNSYGPFMLSLSEFKLSPFEYSRVPWNAVECHQVYNCHLRYCIYQHCFCTGYMNKFMRDHHSLQCRRD